MLHLSAKKIATGTTLKLTTTLATVSDSDKTDVSADLSGVINWGDGTSARPSPAAMANSRSGLALLPGKGQLRRSNHRDE